MKHVWAASAAFILACACASSPKMTPERAAALAAEREKVECKTQKVLGHHSPVEICRTKAQWARIAVDSAASVEEAQRANQSRNNLADVPNDSPSRESPNISF